MKKFILSVFLLFLISFVGLIFYLSFYGYETDKFNDVIKSEIQKSEKNINLDFEKVSILSVRILICWVFRSLNDLPKYEETLFLRFIAFPI